jgi:hypothetical protein
LIRAGSAADRGTPDNSGQERSPNACQIRRSLRLQPPALVWRSRAQRSSSLPPPPTGQIIDWPCLTIGGHPSGLLDGGDHSVLLDDDGVPDPDKVKAAVSKLLARKPHYAKRIGADVGQGPPPGPTEELWGIIQARTR